MNAGPIVDWAGEAIELRHERAALLVRHRTLLVADVHLGKARAFRQQGVPVPDGTTQETLARLDALVRATHADAVVFLGDLLHSRHAQGSRALDQFARWRADHGQLALTLVRGNHDAQAGDPPDSLGITVVEEPSALGAVALCHHPDIHAARPVAPGLSVRPKLRTTSAPPSFMDDAPDSTAADRGGSTASASGRRRPARPGALAAAPAAASTGVSPVGAGLPRIAGHVHPCYHLHGRTDRLRLPCFHFADDVALLPAFGAFTGMHAVRPGPGDRVWVVAGDRIVAVRGR